MRRYTERSGQEDGQEVTDGKTEREVEMEKTGGSEGERVRKKEI